MTHEVLSGLVITKVNHASAIYTPKNASARREARERWAIIIKYEGETYYTANGKRFFRADAHMNGSVPNRDITRLWSLRVI